MTGHSEPTVLRLRSKPNPLNLGIQWGWLKDKWGLSWQIVPRALPVLLASQEPGVSQRVVGAMMQMTKINIAALQRAAAGQ